jgi:hypothetical protein|tara:strand:- start:17 stop:520 length:504 start_codon:yes stop_codon:yes gene_type:complete
MKVKFDINVNNYNGGPQISIYDNDNLVFENIFPKKGPQSFEFETDSKFPKVLKLIHQNKNMKYDTQLKDGNIVDDKGFTINKILLDSFVLENELYLFKFVTDDGLVIPKNNYIGYNGKYIINVDSENLLEWYLNLQKSFINQLEEFDYNKFKQEIFSEGPNLVVNYD